MKAPRLICIALLACTLPLSMSGGLVAKDKASEQDMVRDALRRGEVLPLLKILAIASQHVPGDIIEVELEAKENRPLIYEIKVLTDTGRVREIKIDARTGAVLKIEDD
jgi:uncharacterized membrane protein YkoI